MADQSIQQVQQQTGLNNQVQVLDDSPDLELNPRNNYYQLGKATSYQHNSILLQPKNPKN
jgi:hypothetical protein